MNSRMYCSKCNHMFVFLGQSREILTIRPGCSCKQSWLFSIGFLKLLPNANSESWVKIWNIFFSLDCPNAQIIWMCLSLAITAMTVYWNTHTFCHLASICLIEFIEYVNICVDDGGGGHLNRFMDRIYNFQLFTRAMLLQPDKVGQRLNGIPLNEQTNRYGDSAEWNSSILLWVYYFVNSHQ